MKLSLRILALLLSWMFMLQTAGCAAESGSADVKAVTDEYLGTKAIPTPEPTPTPKPVSAEVRALFGRNRRVSLERAEREYMTGRLLIPDAGIDVALFSDGEGDDEALIRQNICDAEDSAAIYPVGDGIVIADHNNQGFINLGQVKAGDRAYILRGDSILSLECELAIDGHNTGEGLTDADGNPFTAVSEYMCYTCDDSWTNIKIVGFRVIDEDIIR